MLCMLQLWETLTRQHEAANRRINRNIGLADLEKCIIRWRAIIHWYFSTTQDGLHQGDAGHWCAQFLLVGVAVTCWVYLRVLAMVLGCCLFLSSLIIVRCRSCSLTVLVVFHMFLSFPTLGQLDFCTRVWKYKHSDF